MNNPKRGRKASITKAFDTFVDQLVVQLEATEPMQRSLFAAELAQRAKMAQETFGELRTAGFNELRAEGWSLADLAAEFGVTRARAAQVACRDRYKSGESRGGGGRAKQT